MMDYCSKKLVAKQKRQKKGSLSIKRVPFKNIFLCVLWISILSGGVFIGIRYAMPFVSTTKEIIKLNLKDVEIRGNRILSRETILKKAAINENTDLLNLDLSGLEKKLYEIPYIKDVQIRRSLPGNLSIEIIERKPFAILQSEDLWYVGSNGTPFKKVDTAKGEKIDFPILTGVPGQKGEAESYKDSVLAQSLNILRMLKVEGIVKAEKISEINYCSIYGFSVYLFDNPVRVILGFKDIEKKMGRLKRVLAKLNSNAGRVARIDLDYKSKAIVKLKRTI